MSLDCNAAVRLLPFLALLAPHVAPAADATGPMPQFAAPVSFDLPEQPLHMATADFNGDGKPDAVFSNFSLDAVSVLMNTTAGGASTPSFATPQSMTAGDGPENIAIADVNMDGKPDIVVLNAIAITVGIFFNQTPTGAASATFAPMQAIACDSRRTTLQVGDFNGDGRPDLVDAGHTMAIRVNTTAPGSFVASFGTAYIDPFGGELRDEIYVVDLDRDGKPDLLSPVRTRFRLEMFRNITPPGAAVPVFDRQVPFMNMGPDFTTLADVDGDGDLDLIATDFMNGGVAVVPNQTPPGATTFLFGAPYRLPGSDTLSGPVVAADFNTDGRVDAVALSGLRILRNTTIPGTFPPTFTRSPAQAADPSIRPGDASVDINGDGRPDVLAPRFAEHALEVFINTTPPTTSAPGFAAARHFPAGSQPASLAVGDLNGDGKRDLVVVDSDANAVAVLPGATAPGAATPDFAAAQTFATGASPAAGTSADFNGDGVPDLATADAGDATVSVRLNQTPPGASTLAFAARQSFGTGANPRAIATADLDGDGRKDLIVGATGANGIDVLLDTTPPGATTATFAARQSFTVGAAPSAVAAIDLNGDGLIDIAATNRDDDTVSLLVNTTVPGGALAFAAAQTVAAGDAPAALAVADIDLDGKQDLVVADTGEGVVSVLLNRTAAGAATAAFARQAFAAGTQPSTLAIADVSADGRADIVVGSTASGVVAVLFNTTTAGSGTAGFSSPQPYATLDQPRGVAAADVNGDGNPELIVANAGSHDVTVQSNTQFDVVADDRLFADDFD